MSAQRRFHCISLSELGYGPLEFNFGRIAIKTERTQNLFKHLLVTVASLDLRPRLASSGGNSGYTDREESEDENGRKNGLVAICYISRLVIS